MGIQIRTGLFETNSSSIHSMALCTEEEYNRFLEGTLAFNILEGDLTENLNHKRSYTGSDFDAINDSCRYHDVKTGKDYANADYRLVTLSDGTKVGVLEYEGDY